MTTTSSRKIVYRRSENATSELLTAEENERILRGIGSNCYSLAMGVAQILAAKPDPNRWTIVDMGVLVFVKNYNRRQYSLDLYDLEGKKIWEQILYEEFFVNQPFSTLLTFEGDAAVYGMNFSDSEEMKCFKTLLHDKYTTEMKRKEKPLVEDISDSTNKKVPSLGTTDVGIMALKPEGFNYALFKISPLSPKLTGKQNKGKGKVDKKSLIGTPSDFRHVTHLGLDGMNSFGENNLDPGVAETLREIGFDPAKMRKKDKDFAVDFVKRQTAIFLQKSRPKTKKIAPPPPPGPIAPDKPTKQQREVEIAPPPPPIDVEYLTSERADDATFGQSAKSDSDRGDLLAEIRQGKKLAPVDICEEKSSEADEFIGKGSTIAKALAEALSNRRRRMTEEDSDERQSISIDDSEWED